MGDPITWYTLPRTASDIETIMEAIDAKLLVHNQDPSAHGQTGEALQTHRVAALLDHVAYSIYGIKQNPAARIFKAIVDGAGAGDFYNFQEAIDYVHIHGGGKIYIRPGTYTPPSDIVLYSNIEIEGEDDDTVIIDFNNTTRVMKAVGTSGSHLRNIRLKNIQLANCYNLTTGALYFKYVDDFVFEDLKFTDNWSSGDSYGCDIYLDNCYRPRITDCRTSGCGSFIYAVGGSGHYAARINGTNANDHFVKWSLSDGPQSCKYEDVKCANGQKALFYGKCSSTIFISNDFDLAGSGTFGIYNLNSNGNRWIGNLLTGIENNSHGIYLVNCDDASFSHNQAEMWGDHAFTVLASNDCKLIGNYLESDSGKSVYIGPSSNRTIVLGNRLPDGVTDLGTGSEIDHNT